MPKVLVSSIDFDFVGNEVLVAKVLWSERMVSPGLTEKSAVEVEDHNRTSILGFEIANESGAPILIAFGETPDPVDGPCLLVRSGENRQVRCRAGDRIAWAAA